MREKTWSVVLPEEMTRFFEARPEIALAALKEAFASHQEERRLEAVRIITRAKAPVWNWRDLEKEIFKGAIGER